jgi:hypothetical protein
MNQTNTYCTIITSNYLFYIKALYDSLEKFKTKADFHVLVVDDVTGPVSYKNIILHRLSEIKGLYAEDYALIAKYEKDKESTLRWALKPLWLKYLLQQKSYTKALFLDPDLFFYEDPTFLFELLNDKNVILTPHWRSSDPSIDSANFDWLFKGGIYNAGFFGCSSESIAVLEWWLKACSYKMSKEDGFYVDQGFLNLMPIYFSNDVAQVNHRGCNVSNWNMVECERTLLNGEVLINNKYPVVFIHFTNATINKIAKGKDALLQPLLREYQESLVKHNPAFKFMFEMPQVIKKEYGFVAYLKRIFN